MAFDGVTFVTSDPAKWGTGKGSPLTATEADNDLWELLRRLNALEDSPPTATSISNIIVQGSQLSFQMSDGSSFGPFTLPISTFSLRGDYVAGTHYFELDLVSVPHQGLFLVRIEHDGEDPFNPDATDGSGNALYLRVFGEDTYIYDVGFFYPGKPGVGIDPAGPMASHLFVRPVSCSAGLPGSMGNLRVAPDADLTFPLLKNATAIGALTFGAGSVAGAFTLDTDQDFAAGDIFSISPAAMLDASARDLTVTVAFTRVF